MDIQVTAVAIENNEKYEFYFYVPKETTEKEMLDKAFEIAYCKYYDLEMVKIIDIEK